VHTPPGTGASKQSRRSPGKGYRPGR
jgi:hypothetical protein